MNFFDVMTDNSLIAAELDRVLDDLRALSNREVERRYHAARKADRVADALVYRRERLIRLGRLPDWPSAGGTN